MQMMNRSIYKLSVYTVMHFLVDLACMFYLIGMIYPGLADAAQRLEAAVLYNLFAFALPMALGLLADLLGRNALVSCLGCLLIALNYLILPHPWTAVALIGIGNGLFHIGGGRQVLQDAGSRFTPSGVFIASGALGVFLGRQMAYAFRQIFYTGLWVALLLCVLLLAVSAAGQRTQDVRSRISRQKLGAGMLCMSVLVFLVVIIRSYYGFAARFSWNSTLLTGLIFTLCVVAGKAAGGFLADRLGVFWATVISLAGAGILALFANLSPAVGCAMILLFNMTMPMTLTLLAMLWKELPGFAFGTLMMALFLGTLPDMVFHISVPASPVWLFALCLISLALLIPVLYKGGFFPARGQGRTQA